MPQGQIDPFDEGGVEGTRKAQRLEPVGEAREFAQAHATIDPSESAATIGFHDLSVQQINRDLPPGFAGSDIGDPLTEMGGDSIEVEVEATLAPAVQCRCHW